MPTIFDSIILFVISLLVGGFGIYVGARFITGERNYTHAVITAFIGAVAWAILAWIPLIGGLLALIAYIWVINWRYRGGWVNAILIALVAWIATIIVVWILQILGIGLHAIGVPGV